MEGLRAKPRCRGRPRGGPAPSVCASAVLGPALAVPVVWEQDLLERRLSAAG
ncbi:hypothetical protein [Amycolatopsis sp. Hca4]|uniref:hypothetical protein n=1 Tax=Amycolatopsis sp. Hca4 TaxID=2742131 RepID=UPI0015900D1F|nr:hypothetical protein [Amycolatopsis sp. Hca4]QKV72390.1 hypothetical protein HUT10_04785 [Amycolatopsis sp. Hca4]